MKSYREQGISLYLNGILSNPKTIAKACQIAEGGGYMRDYVEDEKRTDRSCGFWISSKKNNKEKAARTDSESVPPDVHNAFGQHKNIITHILKICEKYDFAIQL